MAVEHCRDNGTMSRQKMSRNPEETLEECHDISIDCQDKIKGRMKKECREKSRKAFTKVFRDNCSYVVKKPLEISNTWQGKNVATIETLSRKL